MIINAAITRIDAPGTPDVTGQATWTNGSAIDLPCLLSEPMSGAKYMLGATIKDVAKMGFVALADLAAAGLAAADLAVGRRVLAAYTGEAAGMYEIRTQRDWRKDGISYVEVGLTAVA